MKIQHWGIVGAIAVVTLLNAETLMEVGYSIEKYDESPGLYYENKGVVVLYNMVWKTIVYVNLNKLDNETMVLQQYVHHVEMFCHTSIIRNWTGCAHFSEDTRDRLTQLTKTETLLREMTGKRMGGKRKKRGVFNFVRELSKILFGMVDDDDDAKYYNEQIKLFEQSSKDMTVLMKEQLSVVKSSLGAINNTLADVGYNEELMRKGINNVTNFMNMLKFEAESKLNIFGAKVEVEGLMLWVNNAMNKLKQRLDLLIDSLVNAQKGVLQPQIISPIVLMETLIRSVSAFPKEMTLPFSLSKDSAHLLIRLCELQVYIKDSSLGYVILLPLVNRGNF
jgi:hypothetical protein